MELHPQNPPGISQAPTGPGPSNANQGHAKSDVDSSKYAQHHTIGLLPNQVSPGNHNHDGITSKVLGVLTDYVPTWSATTTLPTLGNGILVGQYFKIPGMCFVSIVFTFGTTSAIGSGLYGFSLPFPLAANAIATVIAGTLDQQGVRWPMNGWPGTDGLVGRLIPSTLPTTGTSGLNQTGFKSAWAANDQIKISGWYPID